jgi:hypothetical protein
MAAVAAASDLLPNLPLFAGGKSFGARMTSQAQAMEPVRCGRPGVPGIPSASHGESLGRSGGSL